MLHTNKKDWTVYTRSMDKTKIYYYKGRKSALFFYVLKV